MVVRAAPRSPEFRIVSHRPTSERWSDLVGKTFGAYYVDELIGKGSSAVVFKATREVPSAGGPKFRRVALKFLAVRKSERARKALQFRWEAEAAARVRHANVVDVVDRGVLEGRPFIAMTYFWGPTLGQLITEQGALPLPFVVRVARDIASALLAVQNAGLVHADLKPENVLSHPRTGRSVLADFGITRRLPPLQDPPQRGVVYGTPLYMSPEQVLAKDMLTTAADVYALGATLYHAATGHTVVPGDDPAIAMRAQVKVKPPDPRDYRPEIPRKLASALLRMLAKTPCDRPSLPALRCALDSLA